MEGFTKTEQKTMFIRLNNYFMNLKKLKPQFTFADVAKHAAKKPRGNNRASKTTTS